MIYFAVNTTTRPSIWTTSRSTAEESYTRSQWLAVVMEAISARHNHIGPRARRSCLRCRERKIKCNRELPCSNCVENSVTTSCSYPPGRGRAPKIPRKVINERLGDRLSRLEGLLRRVEDSKGSRTGSEPDRVDALDHCEPATSPSSVAAADSPRLFTNERGSYYVSNGLWASLSSEVVELREMLDASSSGEENHISDAAERDVASSNATIFGLRSSSQQPIAFRPHISQCGAIFCAFVDNVAPLIRLFHMPSLTHKFWTAVVSSGADTSVDRENEALIFAICYAAVVSLDTEACVASLGSPRHALLEQFRYGTEQAMARADLLNTQSVLLLQAVTLFLFALRNQDDSRTVSSLTALVVHLAQSIGLHRDGAAFDLSPLDIELRRRLWWYICLLDNRSSEYYARESSLRENQVPFDTKIPLLINDADLAAGMTTAPPQRTGPCDMTFCVIRCEATSALRRVNNSGLDLVQRKDILATLQSDLEERFLRHCDNEHPFQLFISIVTRLIIARCGLILLHHEDPGEREAGNELTKIPQATRGQIRDARFAQAIEVLGLSVQLLTRKELARWQWHSRTQIQWYAAALILSEICRRPPSSQCEQAWERVSLVYDHCSGITRKGTLWKPLQRLMARAYFVRSHQRQQQDNMVAAGQHESVQLNAGSEPAMLAPAYMDAVAATWQQQQAQPGMMGLDLGEPMPSWSHTEDASLFDSELFDGIIPTIL